MRYSLRYFRHSGPVIYKSKLPAPSVSMPCESRILQSSTQEQVKLAFGRPLDGLPETKSSAYLTMLIETRAIVLHRTAYSDRYSIVHIYSEKYGRMGLLVSNSRSRKSRPLALLSPLAEVDIVGELKQGKSLATVTEVRLYNPNHQIQMNPIKCSQGIFLGELLYRVLTHEEPDEELYRFLSLSMQILHGIEVGVANFYLTFTYHLLRYLAIAPSINRQLVASNMWFDLREASYTAMPGIQTQAIPPQYMLALQRFSRITYQNMHLFRYNREDRRIIIDYLLLYYRIHLPPFGPIKSLDVLRGANNKS